MFFMQTAFSFYNGIKEAKRRVCIEAFIVVVIVTLLHFMDVYHSGMIHVCAPCKSTVLSFKNVLCAYYQTTCG